MHLIVIRYSAYTAAELDETQSSIYPFKFRRGAGISAKITEFAKRAALKYYLVGVSRNPARRTGVGSAEGNWGGRGGREGESAGAADKFIHVLEVQRTRDVRTFD